MGCNTSKVSDVPAAAKSPPDAKPPSPNDEKPIKDANNGGGDEQNDNNNNNGLSAPTPRPATRSPTPAPQPVAAAADDSSYSIKRLLLLGSAESGKTTLLEQVRMLYKQHFTETEYFHRRSFIYRNIFKSIQMLAAAMIDGGYEYTDPINRARGQVILDDEDGHYGLFQPEMVDKIKCIWKDPSVQKLYARRSTFNLNDSAGYFLSNIDKINRADYLPTERDLIMSYVPTIGVQNVIFTASNTTFQLFDIGGQKIDRRKWATQYEGIDAIFFCLAISEYDQTMNEDLVTNRLDDALLLLQKISQEPQFEKTPIYLFLNEVDVFCEKLAEIPLQNFKPAYQGGSKNDALEFIEELAVSALGGRDKSLYRVFRSCAIDRELMADILAAVFKDIKKRKK